jgi:glycosyltransferase involved in cell wall biosynthesis
LRAIKKFTPNADGVIVSVIMNCYNCCSFLKESIDSVYAQTYNKWEIVFWDNGSTDDSALIAKSYDQRLHYYFVKETTNLGEARNLAITKAAGKYIAFLDCDDIYISDKLEKQVDIMESSSFALCYGSAIIIDKYGNEIKRIPIQNRSGENFGKLLMHYEINMQSVVLRKSIFNNEQISFGNNLKYCPDYNLFMKIASRYSVATLQDYIVKYRVLDSSLSKQTIDSASSEIKFTLDQILNHNPELNHKFKKEFKFAYNKLYYYDAVASIYKNDRKRALKNINHIIWTKIQYMILYIMLLLPISNRIILKLLGR